jgi:rhamnosyltransferase
MSNPVKVSVIIPTKNPGQIFQRVLAAVLSQQAAFDYDVLVLDSGSTDGTLDFVRKCSDQRVRLHEIPSGEFGHGRTRNLAVSLTQGKFIAMITHDACPTSPRWLECLVQPAQNDPQVAGVFGRHIAYENANPYTRMEIALHFAGFESSPVVCLDDPERYQRDVGYRQFLHFFSDNNALLRRTVWQQHPYPDVNFAEDQLWAKTIIEAGWKKAYARDAAVYHSHDYGLLERMQRSFDESFAFLRLFGYKLCPNFLILSKTWAALTRRDLKVSVSEKLWRHSPGSVIKMPLDNFMRLLGYYFGTHGENLSTRAKKILSRDYRVLAGILKK